MRSSVLFDRLQNLINYCPTQKEIANIIDVKPSVIGNRVARDSNYSDEEVALIENAFNISLYGNTIHPTNDNIITLDYYPDVFGSCGNGVFELSQEKDQIIVPKKAFFEKFSPVKQYSVINAKGNSMMPLFYDNDKLIVEHWNGEQIIDNKPYIFCYKDEIFIKRLAKNVDQLMIISENKDYDIRKLTGKQLEDVNIIGQIVGLMRDLR